MVVLLNSLIMLQIKEIVNSVFTSKTYIISKDGCDIAWLVDIGDVAPIQKYLKEKGLIPVGVFLTHAHFDHFYGLPELVNHYPNCNVYVTKYAKEALASDKLNMSKYHETPMKYVGDNVIVVHEGEEMLLFEGEPEMSFLETPGHNPGCLTMMVGDMIFTGDSYIPGVGVICQLPHANKEQAKQSLERIKKILEGKIIYAGHQV